MTELDQRVLTQAGLRQSAVAFSRITLTCTHAGSVALACCKVGLHRPPWASITSGHVAVAVPSEPRIEFKEARGQRKSEKLSPTPRSHLSLPEPHTARSITHRPKDIEAQLYWHYSCGRREEVGRMTDKVQIPKFLDTWLLPFCEVTRPLKPLKKSKEMRSLWEHSQRADHASRELLGNVAPFLS